MPTTAPEISSQSRIFTLASRASQLAQVQTNAVLSSLQTFFPTPPRSDDGLPPLGPTFKTSFMSTAGDKNQSQALYLLGGKALWTKELEVALIEGAVDMVVHCLKDMPTTLPAGCSIGAILKREDPVDRSVIGTSSVRRVAQLKRNFPGLKFLDVRGNLNTRLAKLDAPDGPYAALILAKAGLLRLGMGNRITTDIMPPTLYYAVSQGALAVEIRDGDDEALALCQKLTHWETEWMCLAERACLRLLEGGCSVPVGVASHLDVESGGHKAGTLTLTGCVTTLSGEEHVEHTIKARFSTVEEAEDVGNRLAQILIETGARKILDDINEGQRS